MNRLSTLGASVLLLGACEAMPTQSLAPTDALLSTAPTAAGITFLAETGSASGINASGDVAGDLARRTAVLWSNGVQTTLGPLGAGGRNVAWGINDATQVVGMSAGQAFVWDAATGIVSLGRGTAEAINNAASPLIVGGDVGPMVWERDASGWTGTALPVLEGLPRGFGFGVNLSGVVAGALYDPTRMASYLPVIWRRDGAGWAAQSLGNPSGMSYAIANDVNDAGQVSGWAANQATRQMVAFFWENGQMSTLPALPGGTRSGAYRLNNKGHVAGYSNAADDLAHAVLWTDGVAIDLGMPAGAEGCYAIDANDLGQVVGECEIAGVARPVQWDVKTAAIRALGARLQSLQESGDISNAGVANALAAKVAEVESALSRGNPRAARQILGALAAQVGAQSGKHISSSGAHALATMAATAQEYIAP